MKGADYNELEKRLAKKDGAELVKNSGRGQRKGDARRGEMLIDYKFTEASSFAINAKAFAKHEKDAWTEGYEPVIVSVFENHSSRTLAIVDWSYLKRLYDDLQDYIVAEQLQNDFDSGEDL